MSAPNEGEIRRAIEVAWQIPGQFRLEEAAFLYQLARRKGRIVEIGCYMGRTTALLVQAARAWDATVTSIDPFYALPNGVARATARRWRANLKRQGLQPPELLAMTSAEAAATWNREIALLFIDGDHSYKGVRQDLDLWAPWVKVGGVVALHDMWFPSITGVAQAVTEWWIREREEGRPRWSCLGMRDLTIAFRRDA
jgi:predicted O-methyltransferase YrrM